MKKAVWVLCVLALLALPALAQEKIATTWNCPKSTTMHALPVADQPGHMYAIATGKCTAASGTIAGMPEKEGTDTEFQELMGNGYKAHGTFVEDLGGGNTLTYWWEGPGTVKDGKFVSGSNKWKITGGKGKFKGAKGMGTCTGKGNPDESATWECTGELTMGMAPKPAAAK